MNDGSSQAAGTDILKMMREMKSVGNRKCMGKRNSSCRALLFIIENVLKAVLGRHFMFLSPFYEQGMKKGFLKRMLKLHEDTY